VEEDEMVRRLRAGDRRSFEEIVQRHRAGIFRVVRGHVKSDAEAEDVTQQTFLQALRAIATFRGESSLSTWLHRIAVNAALNHLRDQKRTRAVSLEEVELITNALGTGRMAAREAQKKLAAALEQLPTKQRTTVELRLVHEMSFRAIAEITSSTEESARSNYHHAVKRLRELIGG
jgi:RNA polymerase sigma-70 factor (ECF subfamily)